MGRAGIPEPGRLGPAFFGGAAALSGTEPTAAEAEAPAVEAEALAVEAEASPFEAHPQAPDPQPPALFDAMGVVGARARSAEGVDAVVLGSAAAIGAA
jgi:hypothetical protein